MISSRLLSIGVAATFTLAACTSGGDAAAPGTTGPSETSSGASAGASAAPSAPSGLTPEAYQVALDAAGKPVSTTLKDIGKARTIKTLSQRVRRVKNAVGDAVSQLGAVQPPVEIGTEHTDYLAALRAMDGELDDVRSAVEGRSLCTSAAVLARLGKSTEFGDLKEAGADLAGGGDYSGGVLTVKPPKERTRRLSNGTVLVSRIRGGRGNLTVKNGGRQDSVVTLVKGKKKAVSVYVRRKSTAKVPNIRDGKYKVFFTSGVDYDRGARAFTRSCAFQRFDDPLPYRTRYSATVVRWDNWTITLNKVTGGNASTSDVSPDNFPS